MISLCRCASINYTGGGGDDFIIFIDIEFYFFLVNVRCSMEGNLCSMHYKCLAPCNVVCGLNVLMLAVVYESILSKALLIVFLLISMQHLCFQII